MAKAALHAAIAQGLLAAIIRQENGTLAASPRLMRQSGALAKFVLLAYRRATCAERARSTVVL